jgi:PAS domain S-box-containing protein
MIEDFGDRNLFEKSLGQNLGNLRAILDESPALICIKDLNGRFIMVNRRFELLAGKPAESYLGQATDQAFPPEVAEEAWRRDKEALAEGRPIQYMGSMSDREGRKRTFLNVKFPVYDQGGQPFGVCLIATDITEQKEAERELRESESLFRQIFDHSPFGMNMVGSDGKFFRVNRAFCEMTGYSSEELAVLTIADVSHPEEMERETPLAEGVLSGELTEFQMEKRYLRKDGKVVWANLVATLIRDKEGKALHGLEIVENISPKKAAEEQLRDSLAFSQRAEADLKNVVRELEVKNAELETFTYTVSHDLKSPLVTIQGFLNLIEKDALEGNIADLREDLEHVRSASAKMKQLLDDLLEISRVGSQRPLLSDLSMAELADEALALLRGGIQEKKITVKLEKGLPRVVGDRTRLVQVYQNLVENAVKYMGSQPEPLVEIGARWQDEKTVFFVRDNGIGLDQHHREKVFGLFQKIDVNSAGTGVGLALVERIVRVHGGRVWVESEGMGRGSTFLFTLWDGKEQ